MLAKNLSNSYGLYELIICLFRVQKSDQMLFSFGITMWPTLISQVIFQNCFLLEIKAHFRFLVISIQSKLESRHSWSNSNLFWDNDWPTLISQVIFQNHFLLEIKAHFRFLVMSIYSKSESRHYLSNFVSKMLDNEETQNEFNNKTKDEPTRTPKSTNIFINFNCISLHIEKS